FKFYTSPILACKEALSRRNHQPAKEIMMHTDNYQPIVCDLTVFPANVRAGMTTTMPDLFQAVQAVQELEDGYAFQFPNEPGMLPALAHFIEHERQCCA